MLKSQIKLLCKSRQVMFSFTVMIVFVTIHFLTNCIYLYNADIAAIPAANWLTFISEDTVSINALFNEVYKFAFPLLAALPFADHFFSERKNHVTELCLCKAGNNKYYYSKLAAVFISSFLIMLIPLILNMILCYITFPHESFAMTHNSSIRSSYMYLADGKTELFRDLLVKSPVLCTLMYIVYDSFIAGLMAVTVFQFSFFYDHSRALLLCSYFAVYNFGTLCLETFGYSEYALSRYLCEISFAKGLTEKVMILLLGFVLLGAVLPIPFAKRKLREMI